MGPEIGGKQHQPGPATPASLWRISEGLITSIARMKQQRRGIAIKDRGWCCVNAHQGISNQQGAAGLMQAADLLKAAYTEIEGAK